jgi:threonine dehydratase
LALAGLKRYILDNQLVGAQKRFVAVVSGANMNFDRLRFVAERAELGEGREALLSVEIPEVPGRYILRRSPFWYIADCPLCISFFALHSVIHPRAITEFIYRYNRTTDDTGRGHMAHVFLSFKLESTNRSKEVSDLLSTLEREGMKGFDISDDEMAKSHTRYMIGGCTVVPNERLFRFGMHMAFLILFHEVTL